MGAAELLARKKLRETTVTIPVDGSPAAFRLRALPRVEYRDLLDDHPPPEDGPKADWHPDTFPPALISACVVSVEFDGEKSDGLTVEEATEIWMGDDWSTEEAGTLFLTCWHLNEQSAGLGFTSPGFAMTGGSGRKSATAPNGESPTPSS